MKLQFQLRDMLDINSRTRKLCWRNGEGRQSVRVSLEPRDLYPKCEDWDICGPVRTLVCRAHFSVLPLVDFSPAIHREASSRPPYT